MSDDVLRDLQYLHDLRSRGLSDEALARALLDLTLQAAPPDVADAVRVCAIPAWFDAELLALLLSLPPHRGELEGGALLEQIAAFSFVQPREGGGYVYHEATRARLLDWWREAEHRQRFAKLNERLARHYLALAHEQRPRLSGPDFLDALNVMDAAYPNVHAAWEGAVETDNWELLRDFAYALADYQAQRALWKEKLVWAEKGLAACEHLNDRAGQADMQIILGAAYLYLPTGDRAANLQKAIECFTEALRFYIPEAAPLDYAMTQNNLGAAYADLPTGERAANLQKAIECYQEALQVENLPPHDQAMCHRNRADALIHLHRLDEAQRDCEQARALAPDHPYTHARLGQLAFAREEYAAAVEHYSAAIDKQPEADFYFGRGLAHLALGHQDKALADYQVAIPLADSITIAEARKELDEFAADHPDTPGLDAIRCPSLWK